MLSVNLLKADYLLDKMIKEAIILAGGLGTRLKGVISNIPKPMAPINKTPFIQYLFEYLIDSKVTHVVLAVGYKYEVIQNHFGKTYKNLSISYAIENEPLGTGGGIANAISNIKGDKCFLLNGDTYFNVDLEQLSILHEENNSSLSLSLKEMNNFDRYGTVDFNTQNVITGFAEKRPLKKGFINGGVYALNKNIFDSYKPGEKFSFEKDIMEAKVNSLNMHALLCKGYFIDIGIPEDYNQAKIDLPEIFGY